MTLVAAVIMSLLAISVAMVIAQQVLAASARAGERANAAVAERVVLDAMGQFEAELAKDPSFYLTRLFFAERPRICGPTQQPVAAIADPGAGATTWPASCGAAWKYATMGEQVTGYASDQSLARAEIIPPSARSPHLRLTVLATVGTVERATQRTYEIPDASAVTLYSGGPLNLDTLATTVAVSGTIYSPSTVATPARADHYAGGAVPLAGARVLAECTVSGPAAGAAGLWEATSAADRAAAGCVNAPTDAVQDVRDLASVALPHQNAARSIAAVNSTSCPPATPTLTESGAASAACLQAGASLVTGDGALVSVVNPDGSAPTAYRILFTDVQGVPSFSVHVASTALTPDPGPAQADAAHAQGSGPVSATGGAWSDLGVFPLPATGVIATDAHTFIGQCQARYGGACDSVAPGSPVTILTGTATRPADLTIAGPVGGSAASPLGLVASGQIVIPDYATAPERPLQVAAHVYAAGIGVAGPSVTRASQDPTGTLEIIGSLGASSVADLPPGHHLRISPADSAALPWFISLTPHWRPIANEALSTAEVCGQRSCAAW